MPKGHSPSPHRPDTILADLIRDGKLVLSGLTVSVTGNKGGWFAHFEIPANHSLQVGSYQLGLADGRTTAVFVERIVDSQAFMIGLGEFPLPT
jgi:hypothetical protein